jgi:2-succinyl-5-enolpyruvyl-6-hydroxy-3-cyclohexene-1-carboxylate synthase
MLQYPKNPLAQNVIRKCVDNGVGHVVISPGSRNAPLTIGFTNHPKILTYSVVDERCAAFFALGMAQQLRKPVAIVCTSGSALLNYYPAVAEAFYSNIPLIVISADRPANMIDIGDGQTIRQQNIFKNHVLLSANLIESINEDLVEEALSTACDLKGPVHLNIPFDEPLYDLIKPDLDLLNTSEKKEMESSNSKVKIKEGLLQELGNIWNKATKKMVLVGENFPNNELQSFLEQFVNDPSVLVMIENTANVSHPKFINSIDKLIFPLEEDELSHFQPEILLSLGGLIVSKKIKQHLRKYQPKHHWHVDSKRAFDTFQCLSQHIKLTPVEFFSQFFTLVSPVDSNYQDFWMDKKELRLINHQKYLNDCRFSDLKVFAKLLTTIPNNSQLQLGNSSVIRYSQLFDINKTYRVFCNRGTSGIDGCTSTAIGAASVFQENTVFISGDISFYYDSNALWNDYIPKNFRIIVINNQGGGIFRFIPGPQETNVLDYFETPHKLNAKELAKMFDFEYFTARNEEELDHEITTFYEASHKPRILEIFTPRKENDAILKAYFNYLRNQ